AYHMFDVISIPHKFATNFEISFLHYLTKTKVIDIMETVLRYKNFDCKPLEVEIQFSEGKKMNIYGK
ncbi:hypothetical protein ACJX0J_011337, partial [Zea mays]